MEGKYNTRDGGLYWHTHYMGILKLPHLELYWSNVDMHIATPGISQIMPLVRFQQIFHLTNSQNTVLHGQPGHDRLFKVRSLLDLIVPKFGKEYTLHQHVSVDEAMIKFKGRLGFKQYMKEKPIKWGMKVFVLADATKGYISNLQIYTSKGVDIGGTSDVGLCTRLVLDLICDRIRENVPIFKNSKLRNRPNSQHGLNNEKLVK